MGLDMYAYKVKAENAIDDLTIRASEDDGERNTEELAYWRKHHDLHGWMQRLFEMKGGEGSFNCQPVRLTEEDLFELEQDVRRNNLPQTTGFFFGDNPPDKDSIENDIQFIVKAREAIAEGYAVYYDSWW